MIYIQYLYDLTFSILQRSIERPYYSNIYLKQINNALVFEKKIRYETILAFVRGLKTDEIKLSADVFKSMALSSCLFWNALAALFVTPKQMKNLIKDKHDVTMFNNMGSSLVYFTFTSDEAFILRNHFSLEDRIRNSFKKGCLAKATDIDNYVKAYNERMGNKGCFRAGDCFSVNPQNDRFYPLTSLTPEEIAFRLKEVKNEVSNKITNASTIEEIEKVIKYIKEIDTKNTPGLESTLNALLKRSREKRDNILKRVNEEKKKEQLQAQHLRGLQPKKANFVMPIIQEIKPLEEILKTYYSLAINELESRQYGIPENCHVYIKPIELRKRYQFVTLREDNRIIYCTVTTYTGDHFMLNLYQQQTSIYLTTLQVYVLASIADICSSRFTINDISEKRKYKTRFKNLNNKTKKQVAIRKYPRRGTGKARRTISTGENNVTKRPYKVVWHFRNIGYREASQKAKMNALRYTGSSDIPFGFTFVKPQYRNANEENKELEVIAESSLAESLTLSLNSFFTRTNRFYKEILLK